MKGNRFTVILLSLFIPVLTYFSPSFANQQPTSQPLSEADALNLGTQAYIYGYPLITMDMTRRVMTNVAKLEGSKAPMGQFVNMQNYPNASFHDVTAPNADTLYSIAWLDLAKEPYILHIPNTDGRYYLMPMLSAWTDVFAVPGKRTAGSDAQDFAIVGPNWHQKLPVKFPIFKSPTNLVWIIGRTYCTGTPEDYQKAHNIQDKYTLTPFSYFNKSYTPPTGSISAAIDMKTPVRDQVNTMNAATYFKNLAILMKDNPPSKADAPMVATLAKLGIVPGQEFDINKLDPAVAKGLNEAVAAGQKAIMMQGKNAAIMKNGWEINTKTGLYGTDYLQRAFVAAIGLGANRPQDAIYPLTVVDATNKKLNGANKYIIHFNKDQTPPVNGFWSLTMYNDQYFFIDNEINKYTVSPRDTLVKNQDGSIDIYIQHNSPGDNYASNWLPAPTGNFILLFRFYWPKDAIINGAWVPPAVEINKHA